MDKLKGMAGEESPVRIKTPSTVLEGSLSLPRNPKGIVLFAHGSGSSRLSPRNRYVARVLNGRDIGTLLFDLLTAEEDILDRHTAKLRFDIDLLSRRLGDATDWLQTYLGENIQMGYFGASTGAAAALVSAAEHQDIIRAVVSRGGRPDLAKEALPRVKAPTLLIVGGRDFTVVEMNRDALDNLESEKALVIIPGATHLFEEPGALEEVANLAVDWFVSHFDKLKTNSRSQYSN